MESLESPSSLEAQLMSKAQDAGYPLNGSIELLPLCNMSCDMCYVRLTPAQMNSLGRLRSAEEWLGVGRQMQKAGTLFLLLTGGEPLLYPEFKEVYLGFRRMGLILTINTNGTLIDEEWADFFAKYKPRRVNITLYGPDADTYDSLCHYRAGFEKTMNAVRLLRERGVDVRVGGSATRANVHQLERIIACGEEIDVPVRVDTYMMPATRERDLPYNMQSRLDPVAAARARISCLKREMGPELFPQYVTQTLEKVEQFIPSSEEPKMTCYAGNCSFTINWQGNMRPCVVMTEPSVSVFDVGFEEAWKKVHESCNNIRLNIKCTQCKLRIVCRTCAASALLETGDYKGIPEYMCQYAEESYRLLQEEAKQLP